MSDMEIRSIYKSCYHKLLDEAKKAKDEKLDANVALARVTGNFREWAVNVAELDNLPEALNE